MTTQAEALYQLQQIDLSIIRTQQRLDEIAKKLGDSDSVKAAQQAVDAAAKLVPPFRAKVRDLELEIASTTQKAQATEQQLYSGSVKIPKAMQEMQQEIDSLKKHRVQLEDKLLEVMMQVEEAQTNLETAQAELKAVTEQSESTHADLITEQANLQEKLTLFHVQRQAALTPITPESLKVYTTLKPRKANQPMSMMNGNSCTLCGIEQTMNVVQDVRHGVKLVPCTNCGRILVYKL